MKKRWIKYTLLALGLLALPATSGNAMQLNESGTMTLQGRLTTQGTMRTVDTKGTNLKYKAGDIVSQKNTLMLEYRWNLQEIIPGITSSIYVQPRGYYDGAWDYGAKAMQNQGTRNKAGYYNQDDINQYKLRGEIFTGYIDFSGYDSFARVGKQAFSWGEMSTVRILDGVNPLNTQGPGIAMEERLIPLTMIRANYSKVGVGPFSNVSVEGYWIPGFFEHAVNENSPFGGPISTTPDTVYPQISRLYFDEKRFDHDRFGIKLGVTWGDLNVNLVYYRMASDSPGTRVRVSNNPADNQSVISSGGNPIMSRPGAFYSSRWLAGSMAEIRYVPVDVYGGSFNYNINKLDTILRGEFAYHKSVPFTAWSSDKNNGSPYTYTSDVIKAGVGLDKNFDWKWMNPSNQVKVTFEQIFSEVVSPNSNAVYGWSDPRRSGTPGGLPSSAGGLNISYPGYDGPTSWTNRERLEMNRFSNQSILLVNTEYWDGKIKPAITAIYEWETSALMLIPSVTFTNNTNWDVKTQYTHTFSDTYKSIGMSRDRNELAVTLNYYF